MAKRKDDLTMPFVVTLEMRMLARDEGWPDPDDEVDAFIDHHSAVGWKIKGQLIVDREAAFRTWLRNAKKYGKGRDVPKQYGLSEPAGFAAIRSLQSKHKLQ